MKLLYLCFVEIVEISGISKKMLYQVKAFQNAGFDVKLCYEKIEKDTRKSLFTRACVFLMIFSIKKF